jgi:hypothetical protein
MPGIVLGEASSYSNPILPFFYQDLGLLANIYSIRYEVYQVGGTTVVTSGTLNMDAYADGGDRKETGYYVVPLDPENLSMAAGSYEVVFYYVISDGDDEEEYSYTFEVIEKSTFRTSRGYKAYISSSASRLDGYSLAEKQRAIHEASKMVDFYTSREFFPRYFTLRHSMPEKGPNIMLFQPIIGVGSIEVITDNTMSTSTTSYYLDTTGMRVYNRHLGGLLSPDDRYNPRIAFELSSTLDAFFLAGNLPRGEQNIHIAGVYGYTDPDESPVGTTPVPLQEVVLALTHRSLADPEASDLTLWEPGRVRKAKTRDQEIQLATTISAANSALTGNSRLDGILGRYMRPPYVGAV